ncbi:hypothetical protein [Frankia sp. AgB32]|uniref:hypothetical protein n=1 Tax=Frankia sp. AgB32 TaxID=631119 RepID=UPI00201056CA|nr:hypothetical protein [Frankia sp. AgB32]MCK9893830.1 hypothetical protein [Frankia sp. AgB32]
MGSVDQDTGESIGGIVPTQPHPVAAPGGDVAEPASAVAHPVRPAALWRFGRRHAVFGVLLLLGATARALVLVAYPPALMYLGDSGAYLDQAWRGLWPGDWRPSGYPIFLRLIDGPGHLTRIVVVQHLLTLAVAVGLYAAALRAVRRPWLAALAAAAALLAPWVLDLGQFVLADSLFGVLVAAGVAVLAGSVRPGARAAAVAGLLLGAALCVRTVGYGPLLVAALVLIVDAARSRLGARARAGLPLAAFVLAAAAPIGAYAGWSASEGKGFTVSAHSGYFLYGRVAPFVDCASFSRPDLRSLCDPRPVAQRGAPVRYLWPADSRLRQGHRGIPAGREDLAAQFAHQAVREQPWMLVTSSLRYLAGYLSPVPHETAKTSRADTWELPTRTTNALPADDPHAEDGYFVATTVRAPAAALADWSRLSYPPLPLIGLGLLAGVAATALALARPVRTRRRPWPAGAGSAAVERAGTGHLAAGRLFWLAAGSSVSTLVLSAVTAGFDYRYLGAVIGPAGLAAVVGAAWFVAVLRRRTPG